MEREEEGMGKGKGEGRGVDETKLCFSTLQK